MAVRICNTCTKPNTKNRFASRMLIYFPTYRLSCLINCKCSFYLIPSQAILHWISNIYTISSASDLFPISVLAARIHFCGRFELCTSAETPICQRNQITQKWTPAQRYDSKTNLILVLFEFQMPVLYYSIYLRWNETDPHACDIRLSHGRRCRVSCVGFGLCEKCNAITIIIFMYHNFANVLLITSHRRDTRLNFVNCHNSNRYLSFGNLNLFNNTLKPQQIDTRENVC